jgi:hypothetical protein
MRRVCESEERDVWMLAWGCVHTGAGFGAIADADAGVGKRVLWG